MKKLIILSVFVVALLSESQGQACTWSGVAADGLWGTAGNWSGVGCLLGANAPKSTDAVTIGAGAIIDVSAGGDAASITITGGTIDITGGTLTVVGSVTNSGATISINGGTLDVASITVQDDDALANGLLTLNSGVLSSDGNITLNQNVGPGGNGTFSVTGGTATINSPGILDIQTGGIFNMTGGALKLHTATTAIVATGTWNATGGTVHFTRSTDDTQVIDVALDYPNIEIDGGRNVTVNATITNVNDLTITNSSELIIATTRALSGSGALVMDASTDLTINGDANFPSGYSGTLDAASTVTFAKNNTETMTSPAGIAFGNVVINSTGANLTFSGATNSVQTLFDINNGIVQLTNSNWDKSGAIATTLDVAAGATLQYNNGDFPSNYNTHTFAPSSNVIFNGGSQNVSRASGADITFGNLTIQGGSGTKTLLDNITVAGNLLVSTGTTLETTQAFQITGGAGSVTVTDGTLIIGEGDLPAFAGGYDFDATSSEVVFNDADGVQSVSNGTHIFDNLTINGGNTKTVDDNITIVNTLDINGTTVTLDANANAIAGDFTLNIAAGDFLETSALVPFGGTVVSGAIAATSTTTYNGTAQEVEGLNYGNLIIDQAGTKTLQGTSATEGDVTISTTATFDVEAFTFTGLGGKILDINDDCRLALSGTNNFPTGFGTFTFNTTSTVDYDAAGVQTIAIHDYANLDITGGGTKTIADGTASVTRILDIEDGATLATFGPEDTAPLRQLRLVSTGDGATETARIADLTDEVATGIITGRGVICERDMDLSSGGDIVGWNDWASPIENFRLASWYYKGWPMEGIEGTGWATNPWCSVLTYDANISTEYDPFNSQDDTDLDRNDGWVRGPGITVGNSPGTGFRLYTGARDRELEDIGLPAQGQQVIGLNYTDESTALAVEEGWNLVGNPYMSSVDFDLLDRSVNVAASMWMYSNANNGYYSYNGVADIGTSPFGVINNNTTIPDGLIPSHKAFWVQVTSVGQSITFDESDKVTTGTAFIKSTGVKPKIRVQAQNVSNGYLSAAVMVQITGSENSFEKYDTEIFKASTPTAPNLYFLSEDLKQLSINSIPQGLSSVPLVVEAGVSGDFELRFYDFNDMHAGSCLQLEDKFTGEWFDIRSEPSIIRELSDTTTMARFNIHISPIMSGVLERNATCFGTNDGQIKAENLSSQVIGMALYNELDELVSENMVTNSQVWKDLSPGVYTIRESNTNMGCPSAYAEVEVFEPVAVIATFEKSDIEIDLAVHNGEVAFTNKSEGSSEYIWYVSENNSFYYEENISHVFTTPGIHDISLIAHNGNLECAVLSDDKVVVKSTVGIGEEQVQELAANAFVKDDKIVLDLAFEQPATVTALLFDMTGKEVSNWNFAKVSTDQKTLDIPQATGVYILKVQAGEQQRSFKLFK
ncbi:MAG: hypothetical protein ACJAUV_001649 [Flavobacteriales bacterium]|jgi:hypothetical protein